MSSQPHKGDASISSYNMKSRTAELTSQRARSHDVDIVLCRSWLPLLEDAKSNNISGVWFLITCKLFHRNFLDQPKRQRIQPGFPNWNEALCPTSGQDHEGILQDPPPGHSGFLDEFHNMTKIVALSGACFAPRETILKEKKMRPTS
jgi:hypothetical protein